MMIQFEDSKGNDTCGADLLSLVIVVTTGGESVLFGVMFAQL